MNSKNCLNKVFSFFNKLHKEFSLGFCLVDTFPDHFIFNIVNHKDMKAKITHWKKLDKIFDNSILNPNIVIVIADISIKNNITTSILHIYNGQDIVVKTIYHTMNVTFTEAKLFAIKCRIN